MWEVKFQIKFPTDVGKVSAHSRFVCEARGYIMNYVVEIGDQDGKTCKLSLTMPLIKSTANQGNSTWRVLDEGFIKYRSGGCFLNNPDDTGWASSGNLYLVYGETYGIVLNVFVDGMRLVNDSGGGIIYQAWCVNFKPGVLNWVLIS